MTKTMFELINEAYENMTEPVMSNNSDIVEEATEYVNPPSKCDVCSAKIGNVFYDAKLKNHGWGNVCHSCFNQYGGDDVKNLDDHTGEFNEIFKNVSHEIIKQNI